LRAVLVRKMKGNSPIRGFGVRGALSALFLLAVLLPAVIHGQDQVDKVGTSAANFLQLELGARAVAMGGAYVGLSDDVSALYWNPAGAALLDGLRVGYINVQRYAGIRHQFSGLVVPLSGLGALGVSVIYVDCGDMEITTVEEPEGTGQNFKASDLALGLSFARRLTDRVSFGVTAKYIQEKIWLESATGYALDLGTLYRLTDQGLQIGMAITNFGPGMSIDRGPHLTFEKEPPDNYPSSPPLDSRLETRQFPLPLKFELGVALEVIGKTGLILNDPTNRVTLSATINDGFDAPFRSTWGLEYDWNGIMALRGGYRENYDTGGLSTGVGLNIPVRSGLGARFDYTWVDYGNLESIQLWSLELTF